MTTVCTAQQLLDQAQQLLDQQAIIEANWSEAEKAYFAKADQQVETTEKVKPSKVSMKNQPISLTWSQMVKFNISTSSFPYVDNYTHYPKRTVKNITTDENGNMKGLVKMGGQTLVVSTDEFAETWDIEGKA